MAIFKRKAAASTDSKEEVKKPVKEAVKKVAKAKKAEEKPAEVAKTVTAKSFSALTNRTTLVPLVTEKNAHHSDEGVYVFEVPVQANRLEVREAFRELYKVTPLKVNIARVHGKEKRFGGNAARLSDWKKALITVPKGTRIDVFTL